MERHLASKGLLQHPGVALDADSVVSAMVSAFDHFHTAIAVLDTGWRFLYVNDIATRTLRRTREQLIGQVLWDAFPRLKDSSFERTYREAMADQQTRQVVQHYAHRDAWYCVGVHPTPHALLLNVRDVTEEHRAELLNDRLLKSLEGKLDSNGRRKAL